MPWKLEEIASGEDFSWNHHRKLTCWTQNFGSDDFPNFNWLIFGFTMWVFRCVCVCVYGIRKFPPQQRVSDITIVIIDVVLTPFHQDTIATFTNEINDVKYQMYVYICIHTHVWLWSYMYILYLFLWYNPVNDWTYSFYTPTSLFFGTSVSLRLLWTLGQGEA